MKKAATNLYLITSSGCKIKDTHLFTEKGDLLVLKKQQILFIALGIVIIIIVSTIWIFHSIKDTAATPNVPIPTASISSPTLEGLQTPTPQPTLSPSPSSIPDKFSEVGSEQENMAFSQTVKDVPYHYDTMVSPAVIRLDSDSRLEGTDISTHVMLRDEAYTIFFKEVPDRQSVKAALTRVNSQQFNLLYPKILIHWTSDRQLHVKVLPSKTEKWDNISKGYQLNLSGATTAIGRPLDESQNSIRFFAIIAEPSQLWRYSIDGESKEKLTDFTEPYGIEPLDGNNTHLLLSRGSRYCECDALYPSYYSVYNADTNQVQPYPIEIQLTQNYRGNGSFMADTRGFFYDQPKPGVKAPLNDTTRFMQLPDLIFGASFSKNRDYLIMAVGKEQQVEDFDVIILSMKTHKQLRYPRVIKGRIPEDQAYDRILPFTFKDDGERVYFTATDRVTHEDINYYYDWKAKKVVPWNAPKEVTGWTGFNESADKVYRFYANGGLFKADQFVKNSLEFSNYQDGIWIPNTHYYMVSNYKNNQQEIDILDADTLITAPYDQRLPSEFVLHSVSPDGKWLILAIKDKVFAEAR
jgi:hypothetical protein